MKSIPFAFLLVFCVAIWESQTNPVAMSCDSCGSECARACGTRHFRSCCFNYVKKRSSTLHPYSQNKLQYDMFYRQLPFRNNLNLEKSKPSLKQQGKLPSKHELEPKPRQVNSEASQTKVTYDANNKNFYKPWKDVVIFNDYDEVQLSSEYEPKLFFST